jgi:integrase/recombinase XerD
MRLSVAFARYLHWKEQRQIRFVRGKHLFGGFLRRMGDPQIARITPRQISEFLDGSRMAPDTWWRAYQTLRSFFQFWVARKQIRSVPMPRPKAALPPPFRPYIFSESQLRQLLGCAGGITQNKTRKCDAETLQTMILLVYSTGALIHEAIELRVSEIDLDKRLIVLRRRGGEQRRQIPVGMTTAQKLGEYISSTSHRRRDTDLVFLTIDGQKVRRASLLHNFRRFCLRLGIRQDHGISVTPGMHDLRHTFAVHCLNAWLREGKDAREMLPILSAYMGHVMLRSTEQYLRLVPDRFKKQLARLAADPTDVGYGSRRNCAESLSLSR